MAPKAPAPAPAPVPPKPGTAVAKGPDSLRRSNSPGKTVTPAPKSNALAKQEEQRALATAQALAESESGQNTFTTDDLAIPFLRILQTNSPQVDKRSDDAVDDAEPGMFFNSATKRLWEGEETGVVVVPVHFTRRYTEWVLRDEGGGFIKDHGTNAAILEQCTRNEDGQDILKNGHQIVLSFDYFVFIVDEEQPGQYEQALLSLTSTQLKKARKWNTNMDARRENKADGSGTFNPKMFYYSYRLTSVAEKNEKGKWLGVNIAPEGRTIDLPYGAKTFMAAHDFHRRAAAGKVLVGAPAEEIIVEEEEDGPDSTM